MRRRGCLPTRRAGLGPTRFLLARRLSSYRPGPRLALTFRGPGSRARSPSARPSQSATSGASSSSDSRPTIRRAVSSSGSCSTSSTTSPIRSRTAESTCECSSWRATSSRRRSIGSSPGRLLPSRLALERGHVAPIAPRKVCSDSASSSVAGAEPRWHRPSPPAGMVREECRSSSAAPQPRLLFPVDADAGCRAASLAPRAPRLALRCAATGG